MTTSPLAPVPSVLTLASSGLTISDVQQAEDWLERQNLPPEGQNWLKEGCACDLFFTCTAKKLKALKSLTLLIEGVDCLFQARNDRKKKLFLADMDSTILAGESLDELADFIGMKEPVARITEAAMRGELSFSEALFARLEIVKGLEVTYLEQFSERLIFNSGAQVLMATLSKHGIYSALLSGGFIQIASRVQKALNFDACFANQPVVLDGRLTGGLKLPIVDASYKQRLLFDLAKERRLDADNALAVGDGANDIPMLTSAGLGVAFYAKPKVEEKVTCRIRHGDLTTILFFLGIGESDWAAI